MTAQLDEVSLIISLESDAEAEFETLYFPQPFESNNDTDIIIPFNEVLLIANVLFMVKGDCTTRGRTS